MQIEHIGFIYYVKLNRQLWTIYRYVSIHTYDKHLNRLTELRT